MSYTKPAEDEDDPFTFNFRPAFYNSRKYIGVYDEEREKYLKEQKLKKQKKLEEDAAIKLQSELNNKISTDVDCADGTIGSEKQQSDLNNEIVKDKNCDESTIVSENQQTDLNNKISTDENCDESVIESENQQSDLNNKKSSNVDCADETIGSKALCNITSNTDGSATSNNLSNDIIPGPVNYISLINENEYCKASTSKEGPPTTRKRKQIDVSSAKILGPVICIGDFWDGYDMPPRQETKISDSFELWEKKRKLKNENSYRIIDLETLNGEVNVKVFWCNTKTHGFKLRKFQDIGSIFEHFSKLDNIPQSLVHLVLHGEILTPSDTPHSINYKCTDFIDGSIDYVKKKNMKTLSDNEAQFKILQRDVKRHLLMTHRKTDTMDCLYAKLSEKLDLSFDLFVLHFDGEIIKNTDTMESLELDGDECIELIRIEPESS